MYRGVGDDKARWRTITACRLIGDRAVKVNIFPYGRSIPITSIDVAHAQVLSPDERSGLKGARRTNGIGLPGYAVGWFRLAGGGKALVAVTRGRLLFLPTYEGYSLIVSVVRPDVAMRQLTRAAGN